MKKRSIYLSVIILVTLVALVCGLIKANALFLIWNTNSVNVTAEVPLDVKKVKIEFGISVNTINRINDSDLFRNRSKYTVVFDGENEDQIQNEYGENDFLITYDNKYYISFRQFKFNRRNQHEYLFHFFQKDNKPFVSVTISGKDDMKFTRALNKVSDATLLRCNVPVDSAGYIYNMIELVDPKK